MSFRPSVVWLDEAADLEPWQFEVLNDTLFGRSLTEPPSFDGFPYKRRDMLDDGGLLPRNATTPKQRPPKKQKPRNSQAQRQARRIMRRNRK